MTKEESTSPAQREARVHRAQVRFSGGAWSWAIKIVLLGVFDAVMILGLLSALAKQSWVIVAVIAVGTVAVNLIYLPPNRELPGKYLAPGVAFMLVFSVSVMLYTVYVGFTNYGDGHNGSKADAVLAIQQNNQSRVPDSATYRAAVATKDGGGDELWLIVVDPRTGAARAGNNETPLRDVSGVATGSLGAVTSADGYTVLDFAAISARSAEVSRLAVPLSDRGADGFLHTTTGSQAYVYRPTMTYDEAADTFTDTSGTVYHDSGQGSFVSSSGRAIQPGWKVDVGLSNFSAAITNSQVRGPFFKVLAWTFVFAILSVVTCFALGLVLALIFNDSRMKGRRWFRLVMILPYAFPATMMTMVWSGLFNQDFGFINQVLLGGAQIPWLNDGVWAKVAIIVVNLWLGFPYQFLVATGALQSLPDDVNEAAEVDGASGWSAFWYIKFPLLMVSLAPLLISTFAFNFNNFNLIYMLTRGGPRFTDTSLDVGSTDILISMVYKVAFGDQGRQYGLGSAFAILIFIIVGVISWIGFRQTRALEDIN